MLTDSAGFVSSPPGEQRELVPVSHEQEGSPVVRESISLEDVSTDEGSDNQSHSQHQEVLKEHKYHPPRIGSEYQIESLPPATKEGSLHRQKGWLQWDPERAAGVPQIVEAYFLQVEHQYLNSCRRPLHETSPWISSADNVGLHPSHTHDNILIRAHRCLHHAEYSAERALRKLAVPKNLPEPWNEVERTLFESLLRRNVCDKDFELIQRAMAGTRRQAELVNYYYLWKHTARHHRWLSGQRLIAQPSYEYASREHINPVLRSIISEPNKPREATEVMVAWQPRPMDRVAHVWPSGSSSKASSPDVVRKQETPPPPSASTLRPIVPAVKVDTPPPSSSPLLSSEVLHPSPPHSPTQSAAFSPPSGYNRETANSSGEDLSPRRTSSQPTKMVESERQLRRSTVRVTTNTYAPKRTLEETYFMLNRTKISVNTGLDWVRIRHMAQKQSDSSDASGSGSESPKHEPAHRSRSHSGSSSEVEIYEREGPKGETRASEGGPKRKRGRPKGTFKSRKRRETAKQPQKGERDERSHPPDPASDPEHTTGSKHEQPESSVEAEPQSEGSVVSAQYSIRSRPRRKVTEKPPLRGSLIGTFSLWKNTNKLSMFPPTNATPFWHTISDPPTVPSTGLATTLAPLGSGLLPKFPVTLANKGTAGPTPTSPPPPLTASAFRPNSDFRPHKQSSANPRPVDWKPPSPATPGLRFIEQKPNLPAGHTPSSSLSNPSSLSSAPLSPLHDAPVPGAGTWSVPRQLTFIPSQPRLSQSSPPASASRHLSDSGNGT